MNANTTYEADCTTSLSAGTVAPFAITANLNGAPDPSFPAGASFGASGAVSVTLVGPFIAGLAANGVLGASGVGLDVGSAVFSSTDGTATGSFTYNHTFAQVQPPTHAVTGLTWASGSTAISGTGFVAGDVGSGLAATGSTGLPTGAEITAVSATGATLSSPTTAAQTTAVSGTVYAALTFTDAAVSTGSVFTTAGSAGGHANIGLTSISSLGVVVNLTVPFGGAPGVGTANCLITGYQDAAGTIPGPAQTGATGPAFPPQAAGGPGTLLVAASGGFVAQPGTTVKITPPTAAFVALADAPPTANNGNVSLGVGGTKTITLSTTDTDPTPTTACSLVGTPSDPRLSVTISNSPSVCQATLTDSGSGPTTVTFQFNATDGVGTGNTATETVNIGTPPVDEPLTQQVVGGQLVLSCSSPDAGGPPVLTCPEFQFPAVTLNGTNQTSTGAGSTLFVSDNRGDPTAGWTLQASMVATPIGPGSNTNASCAGVVAFCNADAGTHALDASGNGQIAPSNLSIGSITCAPHTGNPNPAATPGAGGTFATTQTICTATAGQSGGTFDVTKTYTLTIPASVYAGNYWGTVEYLVS